jgi:hypothetical protein
MFPARFWSEIPETALDAAMMALESRSRFEADGWMSSRKHLNTYGRIITLDLI